MNDLTILSSVTMTSREIAEITGKQHKNVLRDIDALLETLSSELSTGFKPSTYVSGDPPREYRQFLLDRDSSICLVAGYDANARMKIVKRWQALEAGEATPAFRFDTAPPQVDAALSALKISPLAARAARAFGFRGNMAALSADRAVRAITGTSPLALFGQTAMISEDQEALLLVTEIEKRLGWKARTVNPRLVECGLQTARKDAKGKTHYELTEQGMAFGIYLDTGKRHGDGTPVQQVKWKASVVDLLGETYPAEGGAA